MITGIDISEVMDYTSEMDTGEQKTVFKLGVIPTVVMAHLKDMSRVVLMDLLNPDGKTPVKTNLGQMQLEYVRFGLKGWENFPGKDGKPLPFQTAVKNIAGRDVQIASDESINNLPDDLMMELASKINSMNSLSGTEVKNLG